jgi:hypothetical protein
MYSTALRAGELQGKVLYIPCSRTPQGNGSKPQSILSAAGLAPVLMDCPRSAHPYSTRQECYTEPAVTEGSHSEGRYSACPRRVRVSYQGAASAAPPSPQSSPASAVVKRTQRLKARSAGLVGSPSLKRRPDTKSEVGSDALVQTRSLTRCPDANPIPSKPKHGPSLTRALCTPTWAALLLVDKFFPESLRIPESLGPAT